MVIVFGLQEHVMEVGALAVLGQEIVCDQRNDVEQLSASTRHGEAAIHRIHHFGMPQDQFVVLQSALPVLGVLIQRHIDDQLFAAIARHIADHLNVAIRKLDDADVSSQDELQAIEQSGQRESCQLTNIGWDGIQCSCRVCFVVLEKLRQFLVIARGCIQQICRDDLGVQALVDVANIPFHQNVGQHLVCYRRISAMDECRILPLWAVFLSGILTLRSTPLVCLFVCCFFLLCNAVESLAHALMLNHLERQLLLLLRLYAGCSKCDTTKINDVKK